MALPTLKDLSVAVGGLFGKNSSTYAAGVGGAATAGALKLKAGVLDKLNLWGKSLGANFGDLGVAIPGALAQGASQTAPDATALFENKYFGVSLANIAILALIVIGGVVLWLLTRSRR